MKHWFHSGKTFFLSRPIDVTNLIIAFIGLIIAIIGLIISAVVMLFGDGLVKNPSITPHSTNQNILISVATATSRESLSTPSVTHSSTPKPSATVSNTPTLIFTSIIPPTPTANPQLTEAEALELAWQGVTENGAWKPFIKNQELFSTVTVEMALVPTGCFDMGFAGEGGYQCIERPFWIDLYEVTNQQFDNLELDAMAFPRGEIPNHPNNRLTWSRATSYCHHIRGGRLPSEKEWEYATRGPSEWRFPWGNSEDEVTNKAVFSTGVLAAVGTKSDGVSWVGAEDMAGNLREWTNSLFSSLPYHAGDGREDGIDINASRVVKGGSWNDNLSFLESTYRTSLSGNTVEPTTGFRCVVDVE